MILARVLIASVALPGLALASLGAPPAQEERDVGGDVRAALGSSRGEAQFDAGADLNGDGHVNVLDVQLARGLGSSDTLLPVNHLSAPTAAPGPIETIFIDNETEFIQAGEVFTITVRLDHNTVPLFGYSVEIEAVPVGGAVGSIDAIEADFFLPQNLIAACACGAVMDPDFSVVIINPDGSAFISSNTDDGSTVLAEDDVNDILARVCLSPAPGSSGQFEIRLGLASALADGNGQPVVYDVMTSTVEAFPNGADINLDGDVGFDDLLVVLSTWGPCPDPPDPCPADISGDGVVGFDDLLIILSTWGNAPGSCSP